MGCSKSIFNKDPGKCLDINNITRNITDLWCKKVESFYIEVLSQLFGTNFSKEEVTKRLRIEISHKTVFDPVIKKLYVDGILVGEIHEQQIKLKMDFYPEKKFTKE